MSKILNLWLVLEAPDGTLKVVKNSDKFLFGASNTVRQRAVLPLETEFDITFDDGPQTFKLLFKAPDEARCKVFIHNASVKEDVRDFYTQADKNDAILMQNYESPEFFKRFEMCLKKHLNYGNRFNVDSFFPIITKGFKRFFHVSTNICIAFINEYTALNSSDTFFGAKNPFAANTCPPIGQVLHFYLKSGSFPFRTSTDLVDSEDIVLWKLSQRTNSISVGDLQELFDDEYMYLLWRVSKKSVERSGGKVWFKKFNNPSEKIEMNKILVALCLEDIQLSI